MIGIYCIINKVNGKKYIGQSWDITKRWKEHDKNPPNAHIKSARLKYGNDNFEYEIIREVSESGVAQCLLDIFEQHYIDLYDTCNNNKWRKLNTIKNEGRNRKHIR